MRHITGFLTSIILILAFGSEAFAATPTPENDDRLNLSKARTAADSVRVLYNLYDNTASEKRYDYGRTLIDVAIRANDTVSALDMIRNVANGESAKIECLDSLLHLTRRRFKVSDDMKTTEALIIMLRNSTTLRRSNDSIKVASISNIINQFSENPPTDLYGRIVMLHAVCLFLTNNNQKGMLEKYTDRLWELIKKLPPEAYVLRNMFYVQAALSYTETGNYERAVEADRRLLEIIDELEANSVHKRRKFRNYAPSRYIVYTRLLSHYNVLKPEEIEDFYSRTMKIVRENELAAEAFRETPRADIYYAMSRKDYRRAIPLLRAAIDNPANIEKQSFFLRMIIECAQAVDDKATLQWASDKYIKNLETFINENLEGKYNELRIMYDLHELEDRVQTLDVEKRETESRFNRNMTIFASVAITLLLILVVFLIILYRRSRRLAVNLRRSNTQLRAERDKIRESNAALSQARDMAVKANNMRTDLVRSIAHEIAVPVQAISEYSRLITDLNEGANNEISRNFVALIDQNSALLNTMTNDLLTLSDIDRSSLSVCPTPMDVVKVCRTTTESMRSFCQPGVELTMTGLESINAVSDPERVQQVLVYLLANALKFTKKGTVTVNCDIDDAGMVHVTVTDTGIGISEAARPHIFERFYKSDKEVPGAGLGLPISRIIAGMLGGTVEHDAAYNNGARFIFSFPAFRN